MLDAVPAATAISLIVAWATRLHRNSVGSPVATTAGADRTSAVTNVPAVTGSDWMATLSLSAARTSVPAYQTEATTSNSVPGSAVGMVIEARVAPAPGLVTDAVAAWVVIWSAPVRAAVLDGSAAVQLHARRRDGAGGSPDDR